MLFVTYRKQKSPSKVRFSCQRKTRYIFAFKGWYVGVKWWLKGEAFTVPYKCVCCQGYHNTKQWRFIWDKRK